jgi:hypothetical protein
VAVRTQYAPPRGGCRSARRPTPTGSCPYRRCSPLSRGRYDSDDEDGIEVAVECDLFRPDRCDLQSAEHGGGAAPGRGAAGGSRGPAADHGGEPQPDRARRARTRPRQGGGGDRISVGPAAPGVKVRSLPVRQVRMNVPFVRRVRLRPSRRPRPRARRTPCRPRRCAARRAHRRTRRARRTLW